MSFKTNKAPKETSFKTTTTLVGRLDFGSNQGATARRKLEALRQLIDDGENSGELVEWNFETFLDRMKEDAPKK